MNEKSLRKALEKIEHSGCIEDAHIARAALDSLAPEEPDLREAAMDRLIRAAKVMYAEYRDAPHDVAKELHDALQALAEFDKTALASLAEGGVK